jgi:hypothetical protein
LGFLGESIAVSYLRRNGKIAYLWLFHRTLQVSARGIIGETGKKVPLSRARFVGQDRERHVWHASKCARFAGNSGPPIARVEASLRPAELAEGQMQQLCDFGMVETALSRRT